MRNLKRTLSLVLAALMLMSMMVVGAGAATKDFTDSDEIQHKEAVEVMVALNVVSGKDDGSYFAPTDTFTREEMAKVVSYVMNGGVEPVVGTKVTPTYSDIKGIWSEKYIEYCTSMGIISGDGTGKFNPTGTLTAEQAAKMFLTAMGYDSKVFGFVGNDWAINVGRYANEAGLYKDLGDIVPSQPITRDDAMQMAYNAIQGTMMRRSWSQDMTTGQLTETYSAWLVQDEVDGVTYTTGYTLLADKFDGAIKLGYLTGFSYDTNKAKWTYTFQSSANFGGKAITSVKDAVAEDLDLTSAQDYTGFYGQQVKVVYNVDDHDVIYGVYANDSSVVVSGATGNIEEVKNSSKTVTVSGTDYKLSDVPSNIKIYDINNDTAVVDVSLSSLVPKEDGTNLSAYTFELVDNNNDGKIDAVIRTPMVVAKINYVGKDTVQLSSGVTTQSIDTLTTYDGYAAGDWVCFIDGAYSVTGLNTIQKIDLQTAAVSGVRGGDGAVDYTEYQINGAWLAGSEAVATYDSNDNALANYKDMVAEAEVNDTIEYVALGSTIFYAKIVDIAATSKNIAMIVTAGVEAGNVGTTVTGNTLKAKLLFADGSTSVVTVSKFDGEKVDSTYDLDNYIGRLVTYRLDGSNYELMQVDKDNTAGYKDYVDSATTGLAASKRGYINGQVNAYELADDAVVYFLGSNPNVANSGNKSGIYTGKEIKNTWGTANMNGLTYAGRTQVLTQEINGFTYAKVVVLINEAGLPNVTTGSNYGYLSAPTFRSVDEAGKTYLNYTIHTANGVLTVKEENTDAPQNYPQGAVITYDVVSADTVKNVNLANVTTGMVTGWDGTSKISLDDNVSEIDATDSTVIYVDSEKMVGAEGGSIQKAADRNGDGLCDLDNVRYVLSANYVVLLLVDINNEMKADPAAGMVDATVSGTDGVVTAADVMTALNSNAKNITISGDVNLTGTLDFPALFDSEDSDSTRTLTFAGDVTLKSGADWTVNGNLKVNGQLTVESGATLTTASDVVMNDTWTVNGTVTTGDLDLNGKTLTGTGVVNGDALGMGSTVSGSVRLNFASAVLKGDVTIEGASSVVITGAITAVDGAIETFTITINGSAAVAAGNVTGNVENNSTGSVSLGTVSGTVSGSGNTTYTVGADTAAYIVNQ